MNSETVKQLAVRFTRARHNLLLVVAFTTINLVLRVVGSDVFFLFSATLPMFIYDRAITANTGIILGAAVIFVYLLCWIMAKQWRWFIVIALIFFLVDIGFYADFLIWNRHFLPYVFDVSFAIEIAFRLWILISLISGTIAWARLRKLSNQEFAVAQTQAEADASATEAGAALRDLAAGNDDEDEDEDDNNSYE